MHHASCPGAPPPIRPSTHSKASGHSCHSNNKNSTTAPRLHPPSATPWTPVKKHLTLIPIPTPHLPKFSHLAINVDWWVISSSTIQHHVTMYCAAYIMIFSQKYCCISPSLASIVAPSSLQVSCPPVKKYLITLAAAVQNHSLFLIKLYWWIFGFGSKDGDDTVPVGGGGDWGMISSLARQRQRLLLASHTRSHCYSWGWGWSFVY